MKIRVPQNEETIAQIAAIKLDQAKDEIVNMCSHMHTYPYFQQMIEAIIRNAAFLDNEMKNDPNIKSHGIKCDAEGCDFKDMNENINLSNLYMWRNVPCPKCKANLLTDADWQTIVITNKILGNPIIKFINWIGKKMGQKPRLYKMTTDGTGKATFTEKENSV